MSEQNRKRRYWARIFEAIQHPVVILDPSHGILAANPATEKLVGKSEAELLGKLCYDVFHTDGCPDGCPMQRLLDAQTPEPVEMEMEAIGGTFLVSCTPVFADDGALDAVIHIATDISARVSLEKQLRQAQKMEAVGRLAGGMAHDFNNVLTGVGGLAEVMLLETERDTTEFDDLMKIRSLVERGSRLTRGLLAFSRRQAMEFAVVDINDVVARLVAVLGRIIGEDIVVEHLPNVGLRKVRADASQLEQVLMNLAVNARDAMPTGGRLTIETGVESIETPQTDDLFEVSPGVFCFLSVSDTGIGMDEAVRKRIFEPFFTTKDRTKGTGLGLASVFGIVKQHGGFIDVQSSPGEGTRFTVYLPEAASPSTRTESEASVDEVPKGSETILVVEDEPTVRAVVKRILEKQGYEVLVADTPGDARARFEKHKSSVGLLLADVILPDQNGPDLYDTLLQVKPDLKVLFMSGYADKEILERGVRTPGRPVLQKPFLPGELARRVREVIDS